MIFNDVLSSARFLSAMYISDHHSDMSCLTNNIITSGFMKIPTNEAGKNSSKYSAKIYYRWQHVYCGFSEQCINIIIIILSITYSNIRQFTGRVAFRGWAQIISLICLTEKRYQHSLIRVLQNYMCEFRPFLFYFA